MSPDERQSLRLAADWILQRERFLVVSHYSPDGDAIGATLAMAGILKALNKEALLANADGLPRRFATLPWADELVNYEALPELDPGISLIAVDSADEARLAQLEQRLPAGAQILNIDHHPTNTRFGQVNLVLPEAASCTQILYYLAQELEVPLTPPLATCLYTGLMTDTGGFRYSNTSKEALQVAAALVEAGASPSDLADAYLEQLTLGHLKLLRSTLSTLQVEENSQLAFMRLSHQELEQIQASQEDLSGLVQYAIRLEGVEVGLMFTEIQPHVVRVNLRSKRRVDVARIAGLFGGGGHERAAGCTVNGNLNDVVAAVCQKVREELHA